MSCGMHKPSIIMIKTKQLLNEFRCYYSVGEYMINDLYLWQRKILYKELQPLWEALFHINYAVVKGEALSQQVYNEPNKRRSSDIDILLDKKYVILLEIELKKLGFTQLLSDNENEVRRNKILCLAYSHQIPFYQKEKLGFHLNVDVNFDIFGGEYEGERIDIDEFMSDTIEMDIYGCKVKTLPPLKAMIQLILHHYKDMNSIFLLATRKSIRYEMFQDVYYLLKNNLDTITLDKLYAMSLEYEIIPYVFYILYYTGQVFKDSILQQYIEAFRTPEGELLLDYYGLCDSERKMWRYDFETRLKADNLYNLIKEDLTERDNRKIDINKRIFLGVEG